MTTLRSASVNASQSSQALRLAYTQNRELPVAFIDETFDIDPAHAAHFYVLSAVVAHPADLDGLRADLVRLAGTSYWHSAEALRHSSGRADMARLLEYLGDPGGSEVCVVRHETEILTGDRDGESTRARALGALIQHLSRAGGHGQGVQLFVLERRRNARQINADASVKAQLVSTGAIPQATRLMQVSPREEQLLWLPDLICSAYRQSITRGDDSYFSFVRHITTVI